jgi:hypothetical protein
MPPPETTEDESVVNIFEVYQEKIGVIPIECQDAVGVLYSIVTTVSQVSSPERKENSISDSQKAPLDDYYDEKGNFVKLSAVSSLAFSSSLLKANDYVQKKIYPKPIAINAEDIYSRKLFQSYVLRGCNQSEVSPLELNIRTFELEAMVRLQISRILAGGEMPLRPSLSEVERGIKESELLTFTSLSANDLYRSNQLQEFSEMILKTTKALPNFTGDLSIVDGEEGSVLKRKYFKSVPAFTFGQILAQELLTDPLILKKYYNMTDELLFCLHWPPPDRRNKKTIWQRTIIEADDNINHTNEENDHHDDHQSETQSKSSRKKSNKAEEEEPHQLQREIIWETVTLMPAGQMVGMVHRFNQTNSKSWFSALLKNYFVAFRINSLSPEELLQLQEYETEKKRIQELKSSKKKRNSVSQIEPAVLTAIPPTQSYHFYCESKENVRIMSYLGKPAIENKKPDKHGTISLQISYPNDLTIQCSSNGNIKIESDLKYLLSYFPFQDPHHPKHSPQVPPLSHRSQQSQVSQKSMNRKSSSSQKKRTHSSQGGDNEPSAVEDYYLLFPEKSRFISANGEILRHFHCFKNREEYVKLMKTQGTSDVEDAFYSPNYFFSKEILSTNGNRDLYLAENFLDRLWAFTKETNANSWNEEIVNKWNALLEFQLLPTIPKTTTFIRFTPTGEIHCFDHKNQLLSFVYKDKNNSESNNNIMEEKTDAETKAHSKYFLDGRLITEYANGIRMILFPDATKHILNPTTKMLVIQRHIGFPEIEFDLDVDSACRQHAQGMEIPINKGGERVRSRLSLPDGTGVFVSICFRKLFVFF